MSKKPEIIENIATNTEISPIPAPVTHSVAITTEALTPSTEALLASIQLGGGLKITGVKTVTRPVLKQLDSVPIAVKVIGPIHKGEEFVGESRDGAAKMEPASLMFVVDLTTGEEMTLIANAALKSGLEREYKDGSYVGKYFAIISKTRPHDGGKKQLREYMIKELNVEGGAV